MSSPGVPGDARDQSFHKDHLPFFVGRPGRYTAASFGFVNFFRYVRRSLLVIVLVVVVVMVMMPGTMMFICTILITIIFATGSIVVQVFPPLTICSLPLFNFGLFALGGFIVAVTEIVAQFAPIMTDVFLALLDCILIILHILPGFRFDTRRQKKHTECSGGKTNCYSLHKGPPIVNQLIASSAPVIH